MYRARLRILAPFHRFHAARARCPVCGTCVREDDALGLAGGHIAHAECVLHDWAGREAGRSLSAPAIAAMPAHQERRPHAA